MSDTMDTDQTRPRTVEEEREVERALLAAVGQDVRSACGVLSLFFVQLAIAQYFILPPNTRSVMAILAGVTSLLLLVAYLAIRRRPLPTGAVQPFVMGFALIVLVNTSIRLYLAPNPYYAFSYFMITVGMGIFFASFRWLFGGFLLVVANWAILGATRLQWESDWQLIGYGLFLSATIGTLIHRVRIRSMRLYEIARIENVRQTRALERAREQALLNEERLRQKASTLEAIFNALPDLFFRVDADGIVLEHHASRASTSDLEAPSSEIVGKRVQTFFPSDVVPRIEESFEQVKATGELRTLEYSRALPAGERHYEVGILAHLDEEYLVVVRNTTEQKVARRERDQFFELSADLFAIFDAEGRFREANRAWEEILGFPREQLFRMHPIELVHPDDRENVTRLADPILNGSETVRIEIRYRCADGSYRWISWTARGFRRHNFIYAIGRDVTAQKEAEQALRASEERYRDLFENANDLIQSIAPDGTFVYTNRAWRRTLGYSERELKTLTVFDIVHPSSREHCHAIFKRVLAGESVERIEADFVTKEGKRITVEGNVNCRFENGVPVATRGIFRDITERKELERLKDEFIATVSHELRTPLTSISGALDLLLAGAVGEISESVREMLDIVANNSRRLIRLVNDILDLQRIETGKTMFYPEPLHVADLIQEAVTVNRGLADKWDVRFRVEEPLPAAVIHADRGRLLQVLANLLSNAVKFSPAGETVTLSATKREGNVRIAVTDHGPGIPEAFREHLFERFAQADTAAARYREGTGLGLSISKAVIEMSGGRIGYEPGPSGGATFFFELPEWREERKGAEASEACTTDVDGREHI